jgi:archaellum component FlaC
MTGKKRFEMVDEYLISYDGDYFGLHKPSDIRSLVNVVNYIVDENEQLKQSLQNKMDSDAYWEKKAKEKIKELETEIKRLKKENTNLRFELDTHKHPLWSTREAERIVNEIKKENEQLKKENTFLKKAIKDHLDYNPILDEIGLISDD